MMAIAPLTLILFNRNERSGVIDVIGWGGKISLFVV